MEEAKIREMAKEIAAGAPEGDWYLLPPGAHNVVGYLTADGIGAVAYKGKPMNVAALLEEAIVLMASKITSHS